jgi:hypothetical protein
MQLSIVGCPDKKRFRPFVKRAAQFYAKELLSEKMLDNIFVRVKFNKALDAYGYASVEDYNDSGKPREFEIKLWHMNLFTLNNMFMVKPMRN